MRDGLREAIRRRVVTMMGGVRGSVGSVKLGEQCKETLLIWYQCYFSDTPIDSIR
jgi:hypothetical protein